MNDISRLHYLQQDHTKSVEQVKHSLMNKGTLFLRKRIPVPINMTLLPTPVHRHNYQHLINSQAPLNLLINRSSQDTDFIVSVLEGVQSVDYMAMKLLGLYKECINDDNQITLGIFRHDYMYHNNDNNNYNNNCSAYSFKQVEFNLMSAALLGLCSTVNEIHQKVLLSNWPECNVPEKHDLSIIIGGIYKGWLLYNRPESIFCLIVEDLYDANWFDIQKIIDELWERYGVVSDKVTYNELVIEGTVVNGRYYMRGMEIAVFYFRTMYLEEHFVNSEYWEHRLIIEKCLAIKVPNIKHQVLNLKYFQLALLEDGRIERYLSPEESAIVRSTMGTLRTLSLTPEGNRSAAAALENPLNWVLKPSKEGGGNNVWENDMCNRLVELEGKAERQIYVLMERYKPLKVTNCLIRYNGDKMSISNVVDTTAEFGLFNVFLEIGGDVLMNEVSGPLVRTKLSTENEGGVAGGIAVLDSPYFLDD